MGLDNNSRFDLLLHNFRVASYVDSDTLDEGQYGFDAAFNFHPKTKVAAWQEREAITNHSAAIPSEIVAGAGLIKGKDGNPYTVSAAARRQRKLLPLDGYRAVRFRVLGDPLRPRYRRDSA